MGDGAPDVGAELVDQIAQRRAVVARVKAMQRVSDRRWNLLLDDGVVVELPETGWQKQLDVLENLIVDKGVLERDITEIDLRSSDALLFPAEERRQAADDAGERDLMGETVRMRASAEKTTAFRPGQVAALDIGSTKVVCLIGRAEPGNLRVTGAALRESRRACVSGTVTSLEDVEECDRRSGAGGREPRRHAHPERPDLRQLRVSRQA